MSTFPVTGNRMNATPNTAAVQLPATDQERSLSASPSYGPTPNATSTWNFGGFVSALRRRWFLTLCLGAPVAAMAAFAAWKLIPAPYTAYAEVRVRSNVTPPPGRTNTVVKHKALKQTQMQLVRDRRVISLALQEKGVGNLELLRAQEDPQQWLEENVKVFARGTEFFRISLVGENPSELAKILNAITNAYFNEVVKKDRVALQEQVRLYEKLKADANETLKQKRKVLHTIAELQGPNQTQLDEKARALQEYRLGLLQEIDKVDMRLFELELVRTLRKKGGQKNQTPVVPDSMLNYHITRSEPYRAAEENIKKLKARLKFLKSEFSDPVAAKAVETKLKDAEKEFEELQKKMKADFIAERESRLQSSSQQELAKITGEVDFLKTKKEALKKKLDSAELTDRQIGKVTINLEDQKKAIESQETFVASLTKMITQLRAEIVLRDQDPRILLWHNAEPPKVPSRKKKFVGTAAAGLGSFGFVFLAIAFFDIRSRRINTVEQVVDNVGIPVLGTVPLIPRSASTRKKGRWAGRARYWHSVLTESIDATRTLLLRDAVSEMQVFMVASAVSGEGKTTTACHLATSLARAGNHVLLIDGDLRRPFVHRTFDVSSGPGLAEVLRGEAELDAVLQPSGIARMPVLAAGKVDQPALTLLAQGRLAEYIETWRGQFDYIVIDSSPILPVTDGLLIARHVDGVLFAVRRDVSRMSKVVSACERLMMLGVPVLGAVAIGLEHDDYAYHSYYGYNTAEVEG